MLCFAIVLVGISLSLKAQKEEKEETNSNTNSGEKTDAMQFKEEYEALNGQENTANQKKYLSITIPEDNPMKYTSLEEVLELLDHGTGIIYFGRPNCPWCRNAVPVLVDAAQENGVKDIFYYNVNEVKNEWAVQDGKVVKTQEEKEGYYDLLAALDKYLDEYTVTDEEGKEYSVGEKRVYVPMVVFIKGGKIVGTHVGTVILSGTQTAYDELSSDQKKELRDIYTKYIDEVMEPDYCDEDC